MSHFLINRRLNESPNDLVRMVPAHCGDETVE